MLIHKYKENDIVLIKYPLIKYKDDIYRNFNRIVKIKRLLFEKDGVSDITYMTYHMQYDYNLNLLDLPYHFVTGGIMYGCVYSIVFLFGNENSSIIIHESNIKQLLHASPESKNYSNFRDLLEY